MVLVLAIGTFVSTFTGGLVALRNRDRLHLVLGFTAGVLLGVVAFEILPEIFTLVTRTRSDPLLPMLGLVAGFMGFHVVEKSVLLHGAQEAEYHDHEHPHVPQVGVLSALALSTHSFTDGVAIGLAFQVNAEVGVTVATAVIAHDFADGLNTVGIMLAHDNSRRRSLSLLLLDAVAPMLGAAATLLFRVPDRALLGYLGFFAGFLLYLGASDILPQAHSRHPSWLTIVSTLAGLAMIFVVSRVG